MPTRRAGVESKEGLPADLTSRAVDEYLETLDDVAFGAATKVVPKFISPADPAARWTGADGGAAYFAYSTNYMVDFGQCRHRGRRTDGSDPTCRSAGSKGHDRPCT